MSKDKSYIDRMGNMVEIRPNGSKRVVSVNNQPSMTIQEQRDQVDIHKILARHKRTGIMSNIRSDSPIYGDFSKITDYSSARIALANAERAFTELPNEIRKYFDHDPAKLLDFLDNPENRDKAIELGLINKEVPPQPIPVVVQGGLPDEPTGE